jgi:hypothetical protein
MPIFTSVLPDCGPRAMIMAHDTGIISSEQV